MKIFPYGATNGVTGSCFFVLASERRILVDCGFFQGDDEQSNPSDFPFDPASIDLLVLTHAHLDHTGRVPLLVKRGFAGKIICTRGTRDLTRIILLDAAKVMYEDFGVRRRKAERQGERADRPLFTEEDVIAVYDSFETVDYCQPVALGDTITITLRDAGHILGSAFVEIRAVENGKVIRVVFSGDLGNRRKPIVRDPSPPADAEYAFLESTYGDRVHRSFEGSCAELAEAIEWAFGRGGNVVIPSFALERAQELLYILRQMYVEKRLPACRVYLDSPLAITATNLFRENREFFDDEARTLLARGQDPFYFPYLIFSRSMEDSKNINNIKGRAIIIAGSGMCTGGRILHHLKHNLWDECNCVVFIGYQARGTIGRRIVDGEKRVVIYGEPVQVRSRVFTINGFSSHADREILLDWVKHMPSLKGIYLIHGENDTKQKFRDALRNELKCDVSIAAYGREITL